MPRKKTTPAAKPDAILPDELLEKLIPGPMDAAGAPRVRILVAPIGPEL
ncbi:hypothetical protein [Tepidimonas sp. HKU78]